MEDLFYHADTETKRSICIGRVEVYIRQVRQKLGFTDLEAKLKVVQKDMQYCGLTTLNMHITRVNRILEEQVCMTVRNFLSLGACSHLLGKNADSEQVLDQK